MKKLIVLSAVVIGAVVAVKQCKRKPGIQARRMDGLDIDLGLESVLEEMEKRERLKSINRKIQSGSVF